MKRKITLSIALALSIVLISLMSSDSTTHAQNQLRYSADTGVVTLGVNQEMRLSILSGTPTANGTFNFRLRRMGYTQESCAGGVCKLAVASQTTSDVITLLPNEALWGQLPPSEDFDGVRAVVLSDSRDVKVNAVIINTATGEIVATTDLIIDVSGY
jgi:hypothetical protein